MTRERLPNCRPNVTTSVRWPVDGERQIHATAGLDPQTGAVSELFLRGGGRVGSEVGYLLDDVAVLASRPLQHDDAPAEIAHDLGTLPDGRPASVVAAAADLLLDLGSGGVAP
jgi:hypothetical protein